MLNVDVYVATPSGHYLFPKEARAAVHTVLLISQRFASRQAPEILSPVNAANILVVDDDVEEEVAGWLGAAEAMDTAVIAYLPPEIVLFMLSFIFRGDFGNLVQEVVLHVE